jgi:hypothetical protein
MSVAMLDLATEPAVAVALSGVIQVGGTKTPFTVNSYWKTEDEKVYMETLMYRGTTLVQRVVADGTHLWNYRASKNEFSSVLLSEENTHAKLATQLRSTLPGQAAFIAQLWDDMYRRSSEWKAYDAFATKEVEFEPDVDGNLVPIAVHAVAGKPAHTWIDYLVSGSGGYFTLSEVLYEKRDVEQGQARVTKWSAKIYQSFRPVDVDFTFVPPKGARSANGGVGRG